MAVYQPKRLTDYPIDLKKYVDYANEWNGMLDRFVKPCLTPLEKGHETFLDCNVSEYSNDTFQVNVAGKDPEKMTVTYGRKNSKNYITIEGVYNFQFTVPECYAIEKTVVEYKFGVLYFKFQKAEPEQNGKLEIEIK